MLMTHFAILDAGERKAGLLKRMGEQLSRLFGLADDPVLRPGPPAVETTEASPTEPLLRIVEVEPDVIRTATDFRWRRHPQLLNHAPADLPAPERDARHEAVRGLFAARAGALDCAAKHFARAAQCHDISLGDIPGFWQLDRAAMMTAVEAYEAAGRIRESSALNAQIRTMYRPRILTSTPMNITPLPQPDTKVSSNS